MNTRYPLASRLPYALALVMLAVCPKTVLAAPIGTPGADQGVTPESDQEEATPTEDSPWEVSANAGIPKLSSGETALAGEADVGYVFGSWSLDGRLATATYSMSAPEESFSSTSRTQFLVGADFNRGDPGAVVDLRARVELEYASYATTFISTQPDGEFNAESSGMSRASVLLGASLAPTDRFSALLHGGLGYQSEVYTQSNVDSAGFSTSSSTRVMGRAAARYSVVPGDWSLRSTLRLDLYSLRRSDIFVDEEPTDPGMIGSPDLVETRKGLDVGVRAFLDWEKMKVAGLVPGLMLGVDYTAVSGEGGDVSALTPLAGIGLVNDTL